jgi:DNA-binding NtrC family response regulator
MHDETAKRETIQIVVASAHPEDRVTLTAILAGSPWELIGVSNLKDAVNALHRVTAPIVLLDQDLDGHPWQNSVAMLTRARRRTRVTLLATAGGPQLCAEVAREGGFDLLTRPFDREQVYTTLICAYAQGKTNWPVLSLGRPVPLASAPHR